MTTPSKGEGSHRLANKYYATPVPNASLLLSFRPTKKKVLITGTRRLAASRVFSILEADAIPIVVGTDCDEASDINEEVQWRIDQGQCLYLGAPQHDSLDEWTAMIKALDGENNDLFAVCITDTLHIGGDEDEEKRSKQNTGDFSESRKRSPLQMARLLASICKSKRIPINVADQPLLCDYSFPASHRFSSSPSPMLTGSSSSSTMPFASSLQIAVTTNGKGCRLAGRIRREIVSKLPKNVGDAVERIGEMREIAKKTNSGSLASVSSLGVTNGNGSGAHTTERSMSLRRTAFKKITSSAVDSKGDTEEEDLTFDNTPLNSPVPQLNISNGEGFFAKVNEQLRLEENETEERKRRMRWVAQMSEYWPIEYLGSLTPADMAKALDTFVDTKKQETGASNGAETPRGRKLREAPAENGTSEAGTNNERDDVSGSSGSSMSRRGSSQHSLSLNRPPRAASTPGHIFLVGSGPGHPGLLTAFAHNLLTSPETDLILSDKLVPSSILSLIPKSISLQIARKFPGNAEGAQSELISLALQGALEGKRVIRLKQGDPFVYGRGGEEVLAFQKAGVHVTVVPGISSALAAPLMLGIPVTQRGAADSLTLCTGVGRGGKSVRLPGYERSRSLIVLMGVARLKDVVKTLCHGWQSSLSQDKETASNGETPAGQRIGEAFPPYTPIAIVERGSSSDQRLVASTLDGIEVALARSGEQRPPGMMLIGWAALSLSGIDGNVDILDDETECGENVMELESRDRARVQTWLGQKGYIIKEGLDEFYSRYLSMWDHSDHRQQDPLTLDGANPLTHLDVDGKGASGWAPPRYGVEGPKYGWGHNEVQLPLGA
ncbi:hypothetical protein CBS101457_003459 [Exobasidium rhododendri]|nr:hypothetical protein CBS101457_003459 [Exobasidium rhododendri]